jgi:hypothetical protein
MGGWVVFIVKLMRGYVGGVYSGWNLIKSFEF